MNNLAHDSTRLHARAQPAWKSESTTCKAEHRARPTDAIHIKTARCSLRRAPVPAASRACQHLLPRRAALAEGQARHLPHAPSS
eukprot:8654089-Lingulodinium_polyedra.AAC.1